MLLRYLIIANEAGRQPVLVAMLDCVVSLAAGRLSSIAVMDTLKAPAAVAVLNTNDDVVEMLRIVLEHAGFTVVSAHVDEIRRGAVDFEHFIQQHEPAVVLYDVPPPYDRQWRFLQHLRSRPFVRDIPFVLTTTNVNQVRLAVGTDEPLCEIVGKPYDLDRIVEAVREAARGKG